MKKINWGQSTTYNSPKIKIIYLNLSWVGHKCLLASTSHAVLAFNEGSLSYAVLIIELGLTASHETISTFPDAIAKEIRPENVGLRRHISAGEDKLSQTRIAESSRKRRDKAVYSSGKFGSEVQSSGEESDTVCCKCNLRDCKIRPTIEYDR